MELEEAIRASIGVTEDEMQQLTQKLQHHIQPVNASTDGQANGIYLMGVSTTQCFIMTDSAHDARDACDIRLGDWKIIGKLEKPKETDTSQQFSNCP